MHGSPDGPMANARYPSVLHSLMNEMHGDPAPSTNDSSIINRHTSTMYGATASHRTHPRHPT